MSDNSFDVAVIGAGPGGYVAAIRAAQLGFRTAVVDEHPAAGGVCLRVGCIPSKALLESSQRLVAARSELKAHGGVAGEIGLDLRAMMKRKDRVVTTLTRGVSSLLKKNGIEHVQGRARLGGTVGQDGSLQSVVVKAADGERELPARNVVVATGSRPATLPGIELDGDRIGTSTEALAYDDVPERLVVIGAGYIGLELGAVWSRLGSKTIVLEYLNRILPRRRRRDRRRGREDLPPPGSRHPARQPGPRRLGPERQERRALRGRGRGRGPRRVRPGAGRGRPRAEQRRPGARGSGRRTRQAGLHPV